MPKSDIAIGDTFIDGNGKRFTILKVADNGIVVRAEGNLDAAVMGVNPKNGIIEHSVNAKLKMTRKIPASASSVGKHLEKQIVISIWCPNCGIPRNAKMTLKQAMRRHDKIPYACRGCGLALEFCKPDKTKAKKKESDFTVKDVTDVISSAGKLTKFLG